MFELYLDSADIEQIAYFNRFLPLTGITTNPSILAQSERGVGVLLDALNRIWPSGARIHIQVISQTVEEIVEEALQLNSLPFDIVVKVPANTVGLEAIKQLQAYNIPLLATAIYTVQQGFMAALAGADYLAPYVNRIDCSGGQGIDTVQKLQKLVEHHRLPCKILAASFKSISQAMMVINTGIAAITLPVDVASQLLSHPEIDHSVNQFNNDWISSFETLKSYQS
jgi:fructose-6-phosphate aldolase 1